jgi:hypothetical protein
MIRVKRRYFIAMLLIAVIILGWLIGYIQDFVAQALPRELFPLYVVGVIGWAAYVVWSIAALRMPSIRWRGVNAAPLPLIGILIGWLATIAGGVSYFLINGMDSMTLWFVLGYSIFLGTAVDFLVVILPFIIRRATSRQTSSSATSSTLAAPDRQ